MTTPRESVWDYPRPPRLEPVSKRLRVFFAGVEIASTTTGYRLLETSHPPVYYFPPDAVVRQYLESASGATYCEFKGSARYWTVRIGERVSDSAAWSYPQPDEGYEVIRDHFAFYAGRVDACFVEDEQVTPQPGNFYGGWITQDLEGPFKGGPGTLGW